MKEDFKTFPVEFLVLCLNFHTLIHRVILKHFPVLCRGYFFFFGVITMVALTFITNKCTLKIRMNRERPKRFIHFAVFLSQHKF